MLKSINILILSHDMCVEIQEELEESIKGLNVINKGQQQIIESYQRETKDYQNAISNLNSEIKKYNKKILWYKGTTIGITILLTMALIL
jgi:hypothetical protein